MKLAELTVTGFADIVSSDAPAPGGGSCAALYGSIGAALTAMVGGLTQGRKKYAEYAEHGYVHIKQEILENDKIVYHRRWTQLGREWLLDMLG